MKKYIIMFFIYIAYLGITIGYTNADKTLTATQRTLAIILAITVITIIYAIIITKMIIKKKKQKIIFENEYKKAIKEQKKED